MKTLEVHELAQRIDEILGMLEGKGETIELTNRGKIVGRIIPASEPEPLAKQQLTPFWGKMEQLADEISKYLPEKVDAVETIREGRREL